MRVESAALYHRNYLTTQDETPEAICRRRRAWPGGAGVPCSREKYYLHSSNVFLSDRSLDRSLSDVFSPWSTGSSPFFSSSLGPSDRSRLGPMRPLLEGKDKDSILWYIHS